MKNRKIASRYAKSILGLAVEQKKVEEIYTDALMILKACEESNELSLLLKSPVINTDKKLAILNEIFKGNASEMMVLFINIIVRKGREALLEDIMHTFISQYKTHKNIETAVITTAVPLDDKLRKAIKDLLKGQADEGHSIELEEKVNKDIIGGLIVRIGDKQLDESIKSKINELEMEFKKNPYIKAI